MTPATLTRIGEALYGSQWRAAIATDLGVAERTIRRWAAGQFHIPDGIRDDLTAILRRRADEIDAIVEEIAEG